MIIEEDFFNKIFEEDSVGAAPDTAPTRPIAARSVATHSVAEEPDDQDNRRESLYLLVYGVMALLYRESARWRDQSWRFLDKQEEAKRANKQASELLQTKDSGVSQEKTCFTCKKPGHSAKDCKMAGVTCFKCGQPGHISSSCPKKNTGKRETLNLVEEAKSSATTTPMIEQEEEAAASIYKIVKSKEKGLCVRVKSVDSELNNFGALVDTGSPVNLVKKSIFDKFYKR
ncbi:uncharacterized protein LOC113562826 [Ooceraea biroi]|uniref:uncharacterized protein LOC113562826 n=1 Tax=Ooceraea biroi TaxID=2015173 RepID=UPI000F079931|nr:uncharacterized protein LOC113562826 [Ooceraea biroi]